MTRTTLHGLASGFRPLLWAEEIIAANFIRDRLQSKNSAEKEKRSELNFCSASFFLGPEAFGSRMYSPILKEKHTIKLGYRAEEGLLVDFESKSFYRVFVPSKMSVRISRDFVFDEFVSSQF